MRNRSLPFVLLSSAVALALSACASGPSVPAQPTFDVVVQDPFDSSLFGIGFLMATPTGLSSLSSQALSPAELIEVETGVYFGDLVEVGAGDTAEVTLPAEDDLPAATLVPAETAFVNAAEAPDCTAQATPAAAEVTTVVFDDLVLPGFVATGFEGAAILVASEGPIAIDTFPNDGDRVLGWAYADHAVEVSFSGTDCDGLVVDGVALEAGWNTLAWTYDDAAGTFTLAVIDAPETVRLTTAF